MSWQNRDMQQIRGKIPLNADVFGENKRQQIPQNANGSPILARRHQLYANHHNNHQKFYDCLPLDQQVQVSSPYSPPMNGQMLLEQDRKSMLFNSNPNAMDPRYLKTDPSEYQYLSGRNSPDRMKSEKMGAIFKPNQMDPRASPTQNDHLGAGISTNYGLSTNKNAQAEALGNVPILAQGSGTGPLIPGQNAQIGIPDQRMGNYSSMLAQYPSKDGLSASALNRGSSLRNAGYNYMNGSPNLNNRSMKQPLHNVYQSKGRHGFNPNAVTDVAAKNLQYLQRGANHHYQSQENIPNLSNHNSMNQQDIGMLLDKSDVKSIAQQSDLEINKQNDYNQRQATQLKEEMYNGNNQFNTIMPNKSKAMNLLNNSNYGQVSPRMPNQKKLASDSLQRHHSQSFQQQNGQDPNYGSQLRSDQYTAAIQNEQEQFVADQLLYEKDPHMLEEQRYFNRLKNFELRKAQNYSKLYNNVFIAEKERNQRQEQLESEENQRREQVEMSAIRQKQRMQSELNLINKQAIQRQINSRRAHKNGGAHMDLPVSKR